MAWPIDASAEFGYDTPQEYQMIVMKARRLALVFIATALIAGCSRAGASPSAPPAAASSPPAASGPAAATRIEVSLTDALKIEPASKTVPAGVPVTFVVTNTGATEHEFYLGDEAAQAGHEEAMQMGGMAHDDPNGIAVEPGQTKELSFTFAEPGETLAGCHVAGHYAGGMKASISVSP